MLFGFHSVGLAAQDGDDLTSSLWAKAVLEVPGSPVTLVWKMVGTDITPSGDQVISGYFYADPDDFAYGSSYNPELFVKIYIATNGWCNIAFNHVTVDPVTVYSAHDYAGTAHQTGTATLTNRLVEHQYNGVSIDTTLESSGGTSAASSDTGYTMTSGLWAQAILQPTTGPVNLVWKTVGADTTPSGDSVVSGYFYADPNDFAYGSLYNPEVFVKIYIATNGWANIAFNHVTVDNVDISSAHQYSGLADQSATAFLNDRLVEHQYDSVVASIQTEPNVEFDYGTVTQSASQVVDSKNGGSVELGGVLLTVDPDILSESAQVSLYAISVPTRDLDAGDGAYGGQILLSDSSYVIGVDRDVTLSGPITLTLPIDTTKLPENVTLSQLHVSALNGGFVIPQGTPNAFDATAGTMTFSFNPQTLLKDFTHQSIVDPPLAAGFPFLAIAAAKLTAIAGIGASLLLNPVIATIDDFQSEGYTTYETAHFNITYRGDHVTDSQVKAMASSLEDAYYLFVTDMQFNLPNFFDFDGQYTVYLDDFSKDKWFETIGATDADGITLPGSSLFEGACYVNNAKPANKWVSTAVHEYFHALQYGALMDFSPNFLHTAIYKESGWLFEGPATVLSGRVVYGNSVVPARDTGLGTHLAQGQSLFDPEQIPAPDVAQDFFYYLEKTYGNTTFYRPMFENLGMELGSSMPTSIAAADQVTRESDPSGTASLADDWYQFVYDMAIANSAEYGSVNAETRKKLNATTTSVVHSQKLPPLSYYIVDVDVEKLDGSQPAYNQPQNVKLKIALTSSENLTARAIIDAQKAGQQVDGFPKETPLANTVAFEETLQALRTEKAGWIRIVVVNDALNREEDVSVSLTVGFEGVSEAGYHILYTAATGASHELKVKNLTSNNEWSLGKGVPVDAGAFGDILWEGSSDTLMVGDNWGKGATLDLKNTPECRASTYLREEQVSITDSGRLYYAGTYEYIYTDDKGEQHRRTNNGIVSCLADGSGFVDVRFDYNQSGGQIDSIDSFSLQELKVAKIGRPIVFSANERNVGLVDTSGAGFRWLTNDRNMSFSDTGWASDLQISDNGQRVIFTTQVNQDHHLIVMPASGGTPLDLSRSTGLDLSVSGACMSPNGDMVLVEYWDPPGDAGLVLINSSTGAVIRKISGLTTSVLPAGSAYPPQFTPDGQFIVFTGFRFSATTHDEHSDLFMMKTDGTEVRNLTDTATVSELKTLIR